MPFTLAIEPQPRSHKMEIEPATSFRPADPQSSTLDSNQSDSLPQTDSNTPSSGENDTALEEVAISPVGRGSPCTSSGAHDKLPSAQEVRTKIQWFLPITSAPNQGLFFLLHLCPLTTDPKSDQLLSPQTKTNSLLSLGTSESVLADYAFSDGTERQQNRKRLSHKNHRIRSL